MERHEYVYMRDYVQGEKGPRGYRIFFKTIVFSLVFSLAFLGVPFPQPFKTYIEKAPKPIRMALESIETPSASAAQEQILGVQRGELEYVLGDAAIDASLGRSVEMNKSFYTVGGAFDSGKAEQDLVAGRHVDPTTLLTYKGTGKAGAGFVRWEMVDYSQGVVVQKGATALGVGYSTKTVDLVTPVTKSKSFVLVSRMASGQAVNIEQGTVTATLVTEVSGEWTQMTIARGDTAKSCVSEWQIVTFDNCVVYGGSFQMANGVGTAQKTGDASYPSSGDFYPVNPANSFLVLSNRGSGSAGNTVSQLYVRGKVTDGSTLDFTRGTTTNTCDVTWYLVEMKDGTTVQRGSETLTTSPQNASNPSPSLVNDDESFVFLTASTIGADNPSVEVMHNLSTSGSTTTLTFTRNSTSANANVEWQIITSPCLNVSSPNGSESWAVGSTQNITWVKSASTAATVKIEYSKDGVAGTYYAMEEDEDTSDDGIVTNDGSFMWTIPDDLNTNCFIRITDCPSGTPDATRYDTSDAAFSIKGSLTITYPDQPNVIWYISDTIWDIEWDYTGTFTSGLVNLYYSTESGSGWTAVPDGTGVSAGSGGSGSFNWSPVDDLPYDTMRVKVESDDDPTVYDESSTDFEIRPKVVVTSPAASDQWGLGTTKQIQWTSTGTHNVKIAYSLNTGVNWTYLNDGDEIIPSDGGSYWYHSWDIPSGLSTSAECRIKVEHPTNENVVATGPDANADTVADGVFEILPSLELTAPAGGVTWKVGEPNNITWNYFPSSMEGQDVKISYQVDGGTWTAITTKNVGSGGTGSHSWSVADAISNTAKIRIEKAPSSTVIYNESESFFIKGRIVVSEPHSGEVVVVGGSKVIVWTAFGDIKNKNGNLSIGLSDDDGATYPMTGDYAIATNVDPTDGTFEWNPVPEIMDDGCKIKVFLPSDPLPPPDYGVAGASGTFELKGQITLSQPNGGGTYYVGDTINITWNAQPNGLAGTLQIKYSTDSGCNWTNLDTVSAATETYPWVVGPNDDILGATNRVRLEMIGDESSVYDESLSNFTIKGELTLTAPDGGQTWSIGTTNNITWTRANIYQDNVDILYSTNSGTSYTGTVVENISSGSSPYPWYIPTNVITGDKNTEMRIQVVDVNDSNISDESDGDFTIKGRLITLSSTPLGANGGGTFEVGQALNITWTTQGDIGNVDLLYSTDSGTSYPYTLISNTPNASGFQLSTLPTPGIPDAISDEVRFMVRSTAAPNDIQLKSASNSEIRGKITVTGPSAANVDENALIVDGSTSITWTKKGTIGDVKIEYSANNGSDWTTLNTVASGNLNEPWNPIPDEIGTDNIIKITDDDDPNVYDESDLFEIKGSLDLTYPDGGGGQAFNIGGAPCEIAWTYHGTVGNIKILYSLNSGSDWSQIQGAETVAYNNLEGSGGPKWSWTIPNTPDPNYRVRIESISDGPYVNDESTEDFAVRGAVFLDTPNGGETGWKVNNDPNTIEWHTTGAIANVGLYYSIDGGTSYPYTIVSSTAAGAGQYPWTMNPDNYQTYTSNIARIKIVDAADANNVWDVGDASFDMEPDIDLTIPNNGETWIVDNSTPYDIEWTYDGSISNVKIEFSDDGGDTWPGTGDYLITNSYSAQALKFPWTPPDKISDECLVRIYDASDSDVVDESQFYFNIKGSITVTQPDDGTDSWSSGSTYDITWDKTGSIGTVKIQYSPDGGSPTAYSQIPGATGINSAAGTWAWNIADGTALGTEAKVKIVDEDDSTVDDESNNGFEVKGGLVLLTPNDNTAQVVYGNTYPITWQKSGAISTVKLEYADDYGTNWTIITNSTSAATESYTWTITQAGGNVPPTTILSGEKCVVKITDTGNPTVTDTSNSPFKIIGKVTLDQPNGGQTWIVDSTTNQIKWTPTGTFANVKLEYTPDNGTTWKTVESSWSAGDHGVQQSYDWQIPDDMNINQTLVRVSDVLNPSTVKDTSLNPFTIKGSLEITAPNDGTEIWYYNETQDITWIAHGTLDPVTLQYSVNNKQNWINIDTNVTGGDYNDSPISYEWTIPDRNSEQCFIKVIDNTFTSITDESDADFSIRPKITVTQPYLDTNIAVLTSGNPIRWSCTSSTSVTNVDIGYSVGGGTTYTIIESNVPVAQSTTYVWNSVPDTMNSLAQIKVADALPGGGTGNQNVSGLSPTFHLVGGLILTHPQGSDDKWVANSTTNNISWTKTGTDLTTVNLYYSTNSGSDWNPTPIATGVGAGSGSYTWNPMPAGVSNTARVKIVDANNSTVSDTSDSDFYIIGKFTIDSPPDNGNVLTAGAGYTIEWQKHDVTGISDVLLEFSTDGGSNWGYVVPAGNHLVSNTGQYTWTVDGTTLSGDCKLKITDPNQPAATDDNTGTFKIQGSITVTLPNQGNEAWDAGHSYDITWDKTGAIQNVKILYSYDSGSTFPTEVIASTGAEAGDSDPDQGAYNWTLPPEVTLTTDARIRVQDASDSTVYDDSNADFVVRGGLILDAPSDANITMVYGDTYDIEWTRFGQVENVELRYSINNGSTYPYQIIASTPGVNELYEWDVPDQILAGNNLRIKVIDATNSDVADASDNPFQVRGQVNLQDPDGGETWIVDSSYDILWTPTGTFNYVQLQYSDDGGTNWTNIQQVNAGTHNVQQSYSWQIPDDIGINNVVKIYDPNFPATVTDTSLGVFSIMGSLDLSAPDGGQVWYYGETNRNITWSCHGTINPAKIELSDDNKGSWSTITDSASGGNTAGSPYSYTWPSIPDKNKEQCFIKVSDPTYPTVKDESLAAFSIRPKITVTQPYLNTNIPVLTSGNAIRWSCSSSTTVSTVNISYSVGGGTTYTSIENNVSVEDGTTYEWDSVPDTMNSVANVKVTDTSNSNVYGLSPTFHLVGGLTLTHPQGSSDKWVANSTTNNISWTKAGTNLTTVNLYYSTNSGSDWNPTPIATGVAAGTTGGTYTWNPMPSGVSNTTRVKIEDANNSDIFDTSNSDFYIMGKFTVTSPPENGNVLTADTGYDIEWDKHDITGITNVKLEFSTDGGSNWEDIGTVSNSGLYGWSVDGTTLSSDCKIRVSDPNGPAEASDENTGSFKIQGSITVTSPNVGNEAWDAGSSYDITWDKTGAIQNVKILYSYDSGSTFPTEIVASTGAEAGDSDLDQGAYNWTIPAGITLSTDARVRVQDASDSTVYDDSNVDFTVRGGLHLDTPSNTNIVMTYGTQYEITWTRYGQVENVELRYSTDNGSTYPNQIVASTPGVNESYDWDVADVIQYGNNIKVKVIDASNSDVADASDNPFKVTGQVTLNQPNGGQTWIVDSSSNQIQWTPTGTFNYVKLEYSNDNGTSWEEIETQVTAGTNGVQQSYDWTIPDDIGQQTLVRVSDPDNYATVQDESLGPFNIMGYLEITAPNGGQTWNVGNTNRNINWNCNGTINPVKIDYSINNGGAWVQITNTATGGGTGAYSYNWNPIPDLKSDQCLIKVSDPTYSSVNDESDATFNIRPVITVTQPFINTDIVVQSSGNPIRWSNTGTQINYVDLSYAVGGGTNYISIEENVDNSEGTSYEWDVVPDTINQVVNVKVTDDDNSNIYGTSPTFHIIGGLELTDPTGGENWEANSTNHNITWLTTGSITNVKLYYSTNSGSDWDDITTTSASDESYSWTMPAGVSNTARVKITDASNEDIVKDESSSDFHIIGKFTVTSPPANGNVLTADTGYDIEWERHDITGITNVKLEFSTDGGSTYEDIGTVSNSGLYGWTVDGTTLSTDCKIKITDPNQAAANDENTGSFKIQGSITVTYPNAGNEAWDAGHSYDITWDKTGAIQNVKILYSYDSGSTFPTEVIASTGAEAGDSDPDQGAYNWTLPAGVTLSTYARIRVQDASDSTVYDDSDADYVVRGGLLLDAPSDTDITMVYGDTYDIEWTRFGQVENVELRYSINNGSTYPYQIIASTPGVNELYEWDVADVIQYGNNIKVKVIDATNSDVADASDNPFQVRGQVTLDRPNGAETFIVDSTENIQWTPTGTFNYVKLEYSNDGGTNWTQIIAQTPAGNDGEQNSYGWQIPDDKGTNNVVRVSDPNFLSTVTDTSLATFNIMGSLDLSAPDGGQVWYYGETNRNITWSCHGTINPAKIELSDDNKGSWVEITSSAAGGNTAGSPYSYTWPSIPDKNKEQCFIRISDPSYSSVKDESLAAFSIRPKITVTQPYVNTNIPVLTSGHPIRWSCTSSTTVTEVNISYSVGGGTSYTSIQTDVPVGQSTTYEWDNVPDTMNSVANVKVVDAVNSNTYGLSPTFHLVGGLTLTHPQGSDDKWVALSTTNNITWTKTGTNLTSVDLYYSTNSGSDWNPTPIATGVTASAGSHTWNPMPAGVSTTARVRMVDSSNSNVFDTSDSDFHIIGRFTVTSPGDGTVFTADNSHNITWNKHSITGIPNVVLQYSLNGGSDYTTINTVSNTGSYGWTVPGTTLSNECKIKIYDPNQTTAVDESEGTFKIQGFIAVTSPNLGSEDWDIGTTHQITWDKTGAIAGLAILYSADSGSTYSQIAGATNVDPEAGDSDPNQGAWDWFIPTNITVSPDARIKIVDKDDSTVYDESDDDFTVKGSLTLTAPSDPNIVMTYGGDPYLIEWTRNGNITNVQLRYSIDNGSNYPITNMIVSSTLGADLEYGWTVPDKIMGNVMKVKIMDAANSAVFDTSDNSFEIIGSIDVNRPNGGLTWEVGEEELIQWTPHGTFDFVRIEYSTDGGSTWDGEAAAQIAAGSDGVQQSLSWPVDDAIGSSFKVRVSDYDRQDDVKDVSTGSSTIIGKLNVTYPDGGNVLIVGDEETITWNAIGTVNPVRVEFSSNGGGGWTTLTTTASGGYGSYNWTWPQVSDVISETCLIRVSDAGFTAETIGDNVSAATFAVRAGLYALEPSGGERWVVGGDGLIEWDHQGSIGNINIYYSVDGGSSYPYSITTTAGANDQYLWQDIDDVLAFSTGKDMKIKLAKVDAEGVVYDESGPFKIVGDIQITRPLADEEIKIGTTYQVKWTMDGSIGSVQILYSDNGGSTYDYEVVAVTSAGDPASENSYFWTIDKDVFPPSTNAVIKLIDTADPLVTDVSDPFKLQAQFDVVHPEVGEVLKVDDSYTIEWTTTGSVADVAITYSTDGGSTYPNTIYNKTSNTFSKSWTVPPVISNQVRVKVADYDDPNAFGISSGNFKIRGVLTITSPNGGQSWLKGETQNITWTRKGPIANIKIEYSVDSGSNYPGSLDNNPIRSSVDATGDPTGEYKVTWTIPDELTTQARVKITDVLDTTVFDESDADFTIKGALSVDYPTVGNPANGIFEVGITETIQWTPTGTFSNVKVQYSTDNGTSYNDITGAGSISTSQGYYDWSVYNAVSETVRIKVSNAGAEPVDAGVSNQIAIKPRLEITKPDSSSFWEVGKTNNITWTKAGDISTVKLEYSVNAGTSYVNPAIVTNVTATDYAYPWKIPDSIGDQVVVKITNEADTSVYDVSDVFEIAGYLDLTDPDGGEVWVVDDQEAITWLEHGSISAIKLYYSTNNGADEYPYAINGGNAITASNRSHTWGIPNAIGTDLKVKIIDSNTSASTLPDTSAAVFAIRGSLDITSPISTSDWEINTTNDITWERHGSITNVSLKYSINSGSTYDVTIASSIDAGSSSSYSWYIPNQDNMISNDARIKISELAAPFYVEDESVDFSLRGRFVFSFPTTGYRWEVEDTQTIYWTTYGVDIDEIVLRYSTDDGSSWKYITTGEGNNDQKDWTVPNEAGIITTEARIKVYDKVDPNTYAISPQFTIHGSLIITYPNGNEVFDVNSSEDITWTAYGDIQKVHLEYSIDNGSNWDTIIGEATASVESYEWTPIPDEPSTNCLVRITDTGDSQVTDVSNAKFSIKGALTLDAPNGYENFTVYHSTMNPNTEEIKWKTDGSIDTVDLSYSLNSGSTWSTIVTDYANTGDDYTTYDWQVPNFISNTARVRVMDSDDSSVKDFSDNDFKIAGKLIIESPNGGEEWKVLTQEQIKWFSVGSISFVQLYYKDSTAEYLLVETDPIANAQGSRSHPWNIPNTATINTPNSMIKIVDSSNADVWDESDAVFAIQANFNITAPSGDAWYAGSEERIIWTTGGTVANVCLKYSTDGGCNFQSIEDADPLSNSNGWFDWPIPAEAVSPNVVIRVEDDLDDTAYDDSNQFIVRATLTLIEPDSGSISDLKVNNVYNVRWEQTGVTRNSAGAAPRVKLQYAFTEAFTNANPCAKIAGTTTADDVTTIDGSGSQFLTDLYVGARIALSSAPTTFATVTAINSDTQIVVDTALGDGGASQTFISDGVIIPFEYQSGMWQYAWRIPDEIVTSIRETMWIRVSDPNDSTSKNSIGSFRVVPDISVSSPDGSDRWFVGDTTRTIDYTLTGTVPNAEIWYSTIGGGSWTLITTQNVNTSGLGPHSESYIWGSVGGIPHINSSQVKIKVVDPRGTDAEGISAGNATIRPKFTLTSLTGGTEVVVGQGVPITWTNTGDVDNVLIEYSIDSGSNWSTILENEGDQNDGEVDNITDHIYTWTIPDDIGYNTRIRISNPLDPDTSHPEAYSASSSDFRIKGALEITNPTSTDSWDIGKGWADDNDIDITWNTTGEIDEVDLFYSTNNGSTFPYTIATSVTNTGTYKSWTVPDTQSGEAVIRIVDAYNTNCSDVLDDSEPFHIVGYLLLLAPDGDEEWSVGSTNNITWEWGGGLTQVTLSYSLDSGSTFPGTQIIGTVPNGSGAGGPGSSYSYPWNVPDKISLTARVKVEAYNDSTVYDISDDDFKIKANFNITSPANGARWVTNRTESIQWIPYGTVSNVTIKYSVDGGTTYPYTIVSDLANVASGETGTRSWQIPNGDVDSAHDALKDHLDIYGTYENGVPLNAKIRVYDAADPDVYGESADFTLDYYNIEWEMRDLLTNQPLSELKGISTSGWDFGNRTSGVISRCPYGQWDFTWSKTGYGDVIQSIDSFSDLTGANKVSFYMETNVIHIWRSETRFAYVADDDSLTVTSWLERDGGLITGGVFWDVQIYEGATPLVNLTNNTEAWRLDCIANPYSDPQAPDSSGVYSKTWPSTGLEGGKVYTVITRIQIGTGGTFTTPTSLEITAVKDLKQMKDRIDIPLSQVRLDVQTALDDQMTAITTAMDAQLTEIQNKMNEFDESAGVLQGAAALSLLSAEQLVLAAERSDAASKELEEIAHRQAARLLIPQSVITGEPAKIRYRAYSAQSTPILDILNFENEPIVLSQLMEPVTGKSGLFEYSIAEIDSNTYEPGAPFTVIVTDPDTKGIESGAVFVEAAGGKLLLPSSVLMGDRVILRFRGRGGWKPTITMLNFEGKDIITDAPMTPLKGKEKEGYFEYVIPSIGKGGGGLVAPGKPVTVTVSEPTTATVESGTFLVETTSLSSLEGLVAAGAGAKSVAQDALESINAVRGSLATGGDVGMALENIKYKLGRIPKEIASEGISAPIVNKVNEIKDQFMQFAGEEGYDFSTLLELGLSESVTVGDIRSTTDRISGASEVMGEILDREFGGSDKPIVQVLFE